MVKRKDDPCNADVVKKKSKKDAANASVFADLQAFDEASDDTRSQTYTRGIDKLLQETVYTQEIKDILLKGSNVTGLLVHLATVYLNVKADHDHTFPGLFDHNYYDYLMNRLAGRAKETQFQDPFLEEYLTAHPLSEELQRDIEDGFLYRPVEHASKQMVEAAKRHLHSHFEDRMVALIAFQLEILMWHKRGTEGFIDNTKKVAKSVFKAAVADDQGTSQQTLQTTLETLSDNEWDIAMLPMLEWCDLFAPLRVAPRARAGDYNSPRKAYLYNVKIPSKTLPILARIRGDAVEYRQQRGNIWQSINQQRPSLPSAFTHEDVYQVQSRLMSPLDWCNDRSTDPLTPTEAAAYKRAKREVQNERTRLWSHRQTPGTLNPPRGFTLLPKSPLKPAFIRVCDRTVGTIIEKIHSRLRAKSKERWEIRTQQGLTTAKTPPSVSRPLTGGRGVRNWFSGIFQLYPNAAEPTSRDIAAKSSQNRSRKMIKEKKSNLQKGLRVLKGEEWVLNDTEFERRKALPGQRPPRLVNSIMTDGLQVQVTLCSRGEDVQAPGLTHLHKAGYSHITETFDVTKHHRGLFKDAAGIPGELLKLLDLKDPNCFIEAVGNDPGGKFISTLSRARLTSSITHVDFKAPPTTAPTSFSATEYRYRTLAKRAQRFEGERLVANDNLREAREEFLNVSLQTPGESLAYASTVYNTLSVVYTEIMSMERRLAAFARVRAREKTLSRLAREMAGGDPGAAALRTEKRAGFSDRSDLREKIKSMLASRPGKHQRTWTRVVFFGAALFGQGRSGPLPRKALLKKVAELCPVILTDEYNTSKKCCGCGSKLVQYNQSRVFHCNLERNKPGCSIAFIDRDKSASVNICLCGAMQMLGRGRPAALCRPKKDVE